MARYGRDYGIRLVDRDLLKDTRWALDRPEHHPAPHTHHGAPRTPPHPPMWQARGYDAGLRAPRQDQGPARRPMGWIRHPMEMPYDAGFRGHHPPRDPFGIGRRY